MGGSVQAALAPAQCVEERAMAAEDLQGLNATFAIKVKQVLECLEAKGWKPRVASGLRTREQQAEKIAQKYSPPSTLLSSKHLCGTAADIIDRRYAWEIAKNHAYWADLGVCAKARGLVWGGDWVSRDVAHVEMK